jgi:hypothetical protein
MDQPTLHALGGKSAPPSVAADLRCILDLPAAAKAQLWEVLGPSLDEPVSKEVEAMLDGFCTLHQLTEDALARPIKACRFLIRGAAGLDLSAALLAEDLGALCNSPEITDLVLRGYDAGKASVRMEILRQAVVDHGKVLTRIEWRVDTMMTSNRGSELRAPIAVVTLHYQEGECRHQITLHAVPAVLVELRNLCDQLLK